MQLKNISKYEQKKTGGKINHKKIESLICCLQI